VGVGVSIGQDFYNALLVMPKLSYHFTDWISLAGSRRIQRHANLEELVQQRHQRCASDERNHDQIALQAPTLRPR
jgi:hypothetical protein